jgi:hypothetical protein
MTDVNWLTVVFDGSAGAVIGTLGAFGAALLVVKRQSRADRALARGERRRATCIELLRAARDFKRDINTMPNLAEDIKAFELRVQAIEDGLWANEPYAKELGGPVAAAFEDLYNAVDIWDDMLVMRGGAEQDYFDAGIDITSALGQLLVSLQDYLASTYADGSRPPREAQPNDARGPARPRPSDRDGVESPTVRREWLPPRRRDVAD